MYGNGKDLGVKYRAFGKYKCKQCGHKWHSSYAWRHFGQECRHSGNCREIAYPFDLQPLAQYSCDCCRITFRTVLDENGIQCNKCGQVVSLFQLSIQTIISYFSLQV